MRVNGSRARRALAAAVAAAIAVTTWSLAPPQSAQSESDGAVGSAAATLPASRFVPIIPTRVLDTREGESPQRGQARLWDRTALSIDPIGGTDVATQLANLGIDPATVTAVAANITAVNAGGSGFSTLWPTGFERPFVSTNNPQFSGDTTANLAMSPLGLDGKLSIYTSEESDYIVDVMGVMVESGATAAGRFVSLGPIRHSDTRSPQLHVGAGQTRHPGGRVRTVDLTVGGVPASASAVVLNVTTTNAAAGGFVTVSAGGVGAGPGLEYSNVNLAPGEARSNQVMVAVNNGTIDVYTHVATDVILDISGFFTGDTDGPSQRGLFVPITPGRLLDSREFVGDTALTGGAPIAPDVAFTLPVAGRLGGSIPATGVEAAVFNVTAVFPTAGGFINSFPSGGPLPPTSSVNYNRAGDVVPNQAITTLAGGSIDLLSSQLTHIVVDATGYFLDATGTPPAGSRPTKTIPDDGPLPPRLPGGDANRPTSGPYDFLFDRGNPTQVPPIKVAWDACRPIRYALNVDRATDEQIATLIDSIKHLELSTGIDFQFAGVTSAGLNIDSDLILAASRGLPFRYLPPDDDGSGPVDVVIGFSGSDDTTEFEQSGVIGIGGSSRGPLDSNRRALSGQGFALLDLDDLETGNPVQEQVRIGATATHEIGHMVGLAHVDESDPGLEGPFNSTVLRDQLMYPFLNTGRPSPTEFSDGDVLGLWELYNTTEFPCNTLLLEDAPDGPWVDVRTSLDDR